MNWSTCAYTIFTLYLAPIFTGTISSENKIMVNWYWWAHWQSVTDESASMPVSGNSKTN
jgi:hypothetical protein